MMRLVAVAILATAISTDARAHTVAYYFDDGTTQGWDVTWTDGDVAATVSNVSGGLYASIEFTSGTNGKIDLAAYPTAFDITGQTLSFSILIPQALIDAGYALQVFAKDSTWKSAHDLLNLTNVVGGDWNTFAMTDISADTFSWNEGVDLTDIASIGFEIVQNGGATGSFAIRFDDVVVVAPLETACAVDDNGDGTYTITCADGSVTLSDGADGDSCAVVDHGDGTYTVTCGDTSVTLTDGADGDSCAVVDNGDGTHTLTCGDTSVTVTDGAAGDSCAAVDNGDGTYTITCGDTSVTLTDGADGDSCAAVDNGNGSYTITCGSNSVTLSDGADGANGVNGADGESCTVVDNGDNTATITCPDGTTVTVGTVSAPPSGCSSTGASLGAFLAIFFGLAWRRCHASQKHSLGTLR